MGKTSSRTAGKLDRVLEQIDRNLEDARAEVVVTRLVQRQARLTADLLAAAVTIARRSGASHAVIRECLENCKCEADDENQHREVIGSLFKPR